ncbi:N-(5'-phosphoribosyl)anthranilate isomerase 1, chloroplastic [Gracilariopsis chorda]|uniref:phosphoribosylanthranilate isomerase n=1 Tax=Gracilariopsis chorda TaxID=448386 RepID=A0A2V3IK22_9FLOR|nr:N-(5'-phosphoribosyl)anthranilate isomerase 1, chloroplastic [Gracilariopsis chorda]|eukprot:PXF42398.1 N-(5'-phosphoribosyl)anthranilate isomerase 1, chloroplastic [Gracilariopsis chorda]
MSDLKAVKVCGVVSPDDARMIVRAAKEVLPANVDLMIGMVLWPKSRRSVNPQTAFEISRVAKRADVRPVALFVDETVKQMDEICKKIDVSTCQLHGPGCRSDWTDSTTETKLDWIDVRDVSPNGTVSAPTHSTRGAALWSIFDTKGGGTGIPFDWKRFTPPEHSWLLAGGLYPQNVKEAISTLRPSGVDVATGVTGEDKCKKDEHRLYDFLRNVVESYSSDVLLH